ADFGSPDLINFSALFRPWHWVRLAFGIGTNTANVGLHGGVTFVPLNRRVSPSATIEGGRFFTGSSDFLTDPLSTKTFHINQIGYDYANLHLGIEVGQPQRWQVYLHGGASYLSVDVQGVPSTKPTSGNQQLTYSNPHADVW